MKEEKECFNCGKKFIPTCHVTRQKYCYLSGCNGRIAISFFIDSNNLIKM